MKIDIDKLILEVEKHKDYNDAYKCSGYDNGHDMAIWTVLSLLDNIKNGVIDF